MKVESNWLLWSVSVRVQVSAYCYNGECRTHQSQCRLWWGNSADNGDIICYIKLNVKGVVGGNCGLSLTSRTYSSCSSGYVFYCTVFGLGIDSAGCELDYLNMLPSLPENRTNLKIFSKIYFVYDFWTCLFQAILDCLYELWQNCCQRYIATCRKKVI